MSSLISCSNCWYNALQAGSIGFTVGYCVEHRIILRRADETTCRRLRRKDLLLDSVIRESNRHAEYFGPDDSLKTILDGSLASKEVYQSKKLDLVNGDTVVNLVTEYGEYNTKIESLAQLRSTPGPRAEIAMLSLGRGYTHRCISRGGKWTSGLHLLWWTRKKLEEEPEPEITLGDLRYHLPVPIERQVELAQWFIVMLRLIFVSDVASHAQGSHDPVSELANIAENAVAKTGTVSFRKIRAWVKNNALARIDRALPHKRYSKIALELRGESDQKGWECGRA